MFTYPEKPSNLPEGCNRACTCTTAGIWLGLGCVLFFAAADEHSYSSGGCFQNEIALTVESFLRGKAQPLGDFR